jgi:uncharacterized protein YciI
MPASADERVTALTGRMLRKKLYVVLSTAKGGPEGIRAHLAAHLDYMIALEKRGVLFASGPFAQADGSLRGDGMTILRAANIEDARTIAAGDPFYQNGVRTFEVREWTLMEGSLGIKVNFSDQSLELA